MTDTDRLQRALQRMADAEGVDAANALILACAPDCELARWGRPLKALTTSEGRPGGIGDGILTEIMLAVSRKAQEVTR